MIIIIENTKFVLVVVLLPMCVTWCSPHLLATPLVKATYSGIIDDVKRNRMQRKVKIGRRQGLCGYESEREAVTW